MRHYSLHKFLALLLVAIGSVTVAIAQNVAKIGSTEYATLKKAIAAATAGQTVTLLNDIDMTSGSRNGITIAANKDVVLDMNGHSIKGANISGKNILVYGKFTLKDSKENSTGKIYSEDPYKRGVDKPLIYVDGVGEFVMESGYIYTVIPENTTNNGQFGVGALGSSKVTINGGTIESGWYAIAGNGTETKSTTITINGGTLISTADYAIYHPQPGKLTVNDGAVIYGLAGAIAMKKGELEVNGGTLTSKGKGNTGTWGDGTGNLKNAALNFCKPNGNVTATIKGGTITAEGDAVVIDAQPTAGKEVSLAISGGTYSSDVSKYCAEGCSVAPNTTDGTYGVVIDSYAKIGETLYSTLQEAINAATAGQTVTVINDVDMTSGRGITVKAGQDVVLDLNGHSIKGANRETEDIQVLGKLTLRDSKENSTGRIYSESPYNGNYANGFGLIWVKDKGEFVMESGYIYAVIPDDTTNQGQFGVEVTNGSTVTINGGTIEVGWSAITGEGSPADPTTVTVNGGTLISTNDFVIYHPQSGKLTINEGATVYGYGGAVSMRGGELEVNGGILTSKGKGDTGVWGNGTGNLGNAALSFCKPYRNVTATIKGGTITAEGDAVVIDAKPTAGKEVSLSISGGTYSSDVSQYCVEGFTATPNADGTYGISEVGDGMIFVYDKTSDKVAANGSVTIDLDQINKVSLTKEVAGVTTTLTKDFKNTGWNAFFVPFDFTLTQEMLDAFDFAKLYAITLKNGSGSQLLSYYEAKVGETITAYFPCLIKAKVKGVQSLNVGSVSYKPITEMKPVTTTSTIELFTFYPVMENTCIAAKNGYYLNSEKNSFVYNENAEAYIPPFTYYMTIQNRDDNSYILPTDGKASVVEFRVIGADETTGITDVEGAAALDAGKVYNLQGVVVSDSVENLPKGIYIRNGRKVVVK